MKKFKSVSSKATHKLKRTLSKLTHKGQHRPSAAERDMELAQGSGGGGPLDFHTTSQEAPATMEWAAAAGVMPRDQWATHMRELEESGVVQVETRSLSGSSARRGDDEAGYEENTRREEERRRRREKREKEARRRRRERKEAEQEDKIARRHSRHSNRSKRSSTSSSSDQDSSSSNSKEAAEKAWEERHRERQREKRRRSSREAEQHGGRRRERRRSTVTTAQPMLTVYAEERTLPLLRTADQDAVGVGGVAPNNRSVLPDDEPQVPMEEDEEEAFYRPASTASEEEVSGPVPLAELAEDVLDEPRVKSPTRDRPSGRDEGVDEEDGFEDYDYASSGPLGGPGGGVNTESDGSLVVPTSLDRLPQLVSPGDFGRYIVTSLGASPPPDVFSDDDDNNNAAETAVVDASTAPVGTGSVEGVAEQPEVALMSPKKALHAHPATDEPIGKPFALSDATAERMTSDADARRESAPSGDAAFG